MTQVFYGKKLFDGENILDDFVFEVTDGIIGFCGNAHDYGDLPIGAVELDGFVMPGLVDCHVHLAIDFTGKPEALTSREQARIVCDGVANARALLKAGVVACRDLGSTHGFSLGIRDAQKAGILDLPQILACGKAISATGGHGFFVSYEADGADEVSKAVRRVVKDGGDVVKLMVSGGVNSPGPEPAPPELTYEEIAAGVSAAHALGRKVAVHTHGETAMRDCVKAGADSIEHGVFMTPDIMDMMKERGTYLVPTLSAPHYAVKEGLKRDPHNADHRKSESVIARHNNVVLECWRRGVNIAFGTDAGTPFNPYGEAYYEAVLLHEVGIPALDVLKIATSNGAALCGLTQNGRLMKGYRADFLVLQNDATADIHALCGDKQVYLGGTRVI